MRRWLASSLLLLAAVAHAEDHAELRKLINARRNAGAQKRIELVLPERVDALPKRTSLTAEVFGGAMLSGQTLVWMEPRPDGRVQITTFTVQQQESSVQKGGVDRAFYAALLRDLQLIRGASLKRRAGKPRVDRRDPHMHDTALRLELFTGKRRFQLADGRAIMGFADENRELGRFGPQERARLYLDRILDALTGAKLTEQPATRIDCARLLKELEALDALMEPVRVAHRVRMLGEAGYQPAAKAIPRYAEYEEELCYAAGRQIVILNSTNPREGILAAANDPVPELRSWALRELRKRYPNAYRGRLERLFESKDADVRFDALALMNDLAPKDYQYALRGLKDPAPDVRWYSIQILDGTVHAAKLFPIALEIVGDIRVVSIRSEAARRLPGFARGDQREAAFAALARHLQDEKEDVRVRGAAATGLGRVGNKRAIPLLREQFRRPPPERPVYLWGDRISQRDYLQTDDMRVPIADALGDLMATEAADDMLALLRTKPADGEHNMRPQVALALVGLVPERAKDVLEWNRGRARLGKEWWAGAIALRGALLKGDPAAMLATGYAQYMPFGTQVHHLARLCGVERLRELREAHEEFQLAIDAAIARKSR